MVKQRWQGVLGIENEITGDGRILMNGSMRWGDLPIPLRVVTEDTGGHEGAQRAGNIETIERLSDGRLWGTGTWDLSSDVGVEAARQVEEGYKNGVSMDLDDMSFEVYVAQDLLREMEPEAEDGDAETTSDYVKIAEVSSDDEIMAVTDGRIRAATLVDVPAFAGALLEAVEETPAEESRTGTDGGDRTEDKTPALTASAGPAKPSLDWFKNPRFSVLTPLTVSEDGQVYGHIAAWDGCHIGQPEGAGVCTAPPRSQTNYSYFLTGQTMTEDGTMVPTGRLTVNTRHAGPSLNYRNANAHYENTGMAAADVYAGEDEFGIWVAGAVRPDATEEQVRALRGSALSGDWRRVGVGQELVGVLAVNTPGFPVPRTQGKVTGGELSSLVASGVVGPQAGETAREVAGFDQRRREDKARKMARRIEAQQLSRRVGH